MANAILIPSKETMPTIAEPPTRHLKEIVLDTGRDLPLHAQLRRGLERIIAEHFSDQSRFYSESQIIRNLKVSQGTVRRALADLAARGLLEKRQARCTIVCKQSATVGLRNLAVFLPDYTSPNVARILSMLNAECQNRGIRMQPIYTHRGERLLNAYNNLNFPPQEGAVVLLENSPRATSELAMALGEKGFDCVVVDTILRDSNTKFVGCRNDTMMQLGLDHLVELGHRRITLLVNEPAEKQSVTERIHAFEAAAAASREPLTACVVHSGAQLWDNAYDAAQHAMEQAMKGPTPPTAIFAISDVGALGAIKWLQQHGVRVPEDVSVLGTGGIEVGAMIHPTLTTLASPDDQIVNGIFHLLLEPEPSQRRLLFDSRLLPRESTAPTAA